LRCGDFCARILAAMSDALSQPAAEADRLLDAAVQVIARDGWARTGFAAIAAEAGSDLARVYACFPDRGHIIRAMMGRADRAVLATQRAGGTGGEESPRDRLFDVLMRRFDALEPMKPALRRLAESWVDPQPGLIALAALPQSMRWMMEAAGLSPTGPGGTLQLAGLCLLYAAVFRVWLRDEGTDLDKTMRALDQALRRAEPFAAWAERWRLPAR
jgi:AcrR family transcriptional regulator